MKEFFEDLRKKMEENHRVVIAIEGRCGSGKTTLAQALALEFDGVLIHTDDFVLPHEKKTVERLAEPGGNLDRERFLQEVIGPLKQGGAFSYRPYCCHVGALTDPVTVLEKKLVVVEGTYSMHPALGDIYHLRVFLDITPEEQRKRLEKRSPDKLQMFLERWIPLEEAYFDAFSIREKCDHILLSNGKEENR